MNHKITAIDILNSFGKKKFAAYAFVFLFFVTLIVIYNNLLYSSVRENIVRSGEATAMRSAEEFDEFLTSGNDAIALAEFTLNDMIINGSSE